MSYRKLFVFIYFLFTIFYNQFPLFPVEPVNETYGKIPVYFVPNRGQVNSQVQFYAKTSRYRVWMTKKDLVFDLIHPVKRDVARMIFLNANKSPEIAPIEMTQNRVNFFKGRDSSQWRTGIPTSKAVIYKNLYNHIDLKVYGIDQQVEYDWIIKPGGNPGKITFEYRCREKTRIDEEGNLRIETRFGEWVHRKPVGYQEIGMGHGAGSMEKKEERSEVDVQFKKIGNNTYGFKVGEYDKSRELMIDPVVLTYSTYLGGSDDDFGTAIAVDGSGNAYITGFTYSMDFPVVNAFQESNNIDLYDVFIAKLASSGDTLLYSTYLGGSGSDASNAIAVDSKGNAYVIGSTNSPDFPIENAFQENLREDQSGYAAVRDAFITKLSPSGDSLLYSTYLGGLDGERGTGVAVDSEGSAYVTGSTGSPDFPIVNAFQGNLKKSNQGADGDVFITKFAPSGDSLLYSTYLGGNCYDYGAAIAVDGSGSAYITGETGSSDFPIANALQEHLRGDGCRSLVRDAFITKFSPSGDSLLYSTYLGGNNWDVGNDIAVDGKGNAYVVGTTISPDFPVANAIQEHLQLFPSGEGGEDVFITKLSPLGNSLLYSTYLGGKSREGGASVAVDSSENAYVTGFTTSSDFPIENAFQENLLLYTETYGQDAFITKLSPAGTALLFSTYLGGSNEDFVLDLAVDTNGNAYVTGWTYSDDFPIKNAYRESFNECCYIDAFVTKIQNFILSLEVSRMEERAWLIRGQFAQIRLNISNPGNIPVSDYIISRKEPDSLYRAIKHIPVSEIQGDIYIFNDLSIQKDKTYTYKAEALDATGAIIGVTNEQTI